MINIEKRSNYVVIFFCGRLAQLGEHLLDTQGVTGSIPVPTTIRRKMSQETLSEELGITIRYVQRLESKNPPNVKIETFEKLAKVLKIKASYLIK